MLVSTESENQLKSATQAEGVRTHRDYVVQNTTSRGVRYKSSRSYLCTDSLARHRTG
jgi:hypothetical protein